MRKEPTMGHPRCSACNDPGTDDFSWLDRLLFAMDARIDRSGWTGMYVLPDRRVPGWGYTIGLSEHADHPELVVVGLDDRSAEELFEPLTARVHDGERFDALPEGRFEIRGHPFRAVAVHPDHWWTDRFNMWLHYYGARGDVAPKMHALQILWPDANDRLPGDPEFDPRLRRRQTRLERAPRRQRRDRAA
jgi:hypothetical protein